jgi:predicted amidophosphoribosyltransferase
MIGKCSKCGKEAKLNGRINELCAECCKELYDYHWGRMKEVWNKYLKELPCRDEITYAEPYDGYCGVFYVPKGKKNEDKISRELLEKIETEYDTICDTAWGEDKNAKGTNLFTAIHL